MFGLPSRAVDALAGGTLVLALGYLVKFRGWTFLVAGYSESTSPVPDDVVADMVGSTLLRVGVATLALGGLFAAADPPAYLGAVFAVAIVLAVARLLYRLNTYAPGDGA